MSDINNNAVVRDLALSSTLIAGEVINPDGIRIPVTFAHKDLVAVDATHVMEHPMFLKERKNIRTVESFIEYLNTFGTNLYIQGHPKESGTIFSAVLDYHTPDQPSYCRHQAILEVENSAQWRTWAENSTRRMSQRKFKEFIEDNVEDILKPNSATLIQQISETKVEAKRNTTSKVSNSGDSVSGDASLMLATDAPDPITLALKPWKCMSTHMELTARIYAHVNENGKVEFSYQIINADAAIEQKFNDYRHQIASDTGKTVYV